jgi:hypothetical protein
MFLTTPVDDLAFGQRLDEAGALLGAGFLEDRAARDDDVAAAAVHLEDLEGLRQVHQRTDVADRDGCRPGCPAGRRRRRSDRR